MDLGDKRPRGCRARESAHLPYVGAADERFVAIACKDDAEEVRVAGCELVDGGGEEI